MMRKCHDCPNPARLNRVLCQKCADKGKVRSSLKADDRRNSSLRHAYGITLNQKKELYDVQQGLCRVCGEPLPEDFRKAHVDHNHLTGQVRALLHQRCNIVVGYLENNLVTKAKLYLEAFEKPQGILNNGKQTNK